MSFDKNIISKDLKVDSNNIICLSQSKNVHKFAFTQSILNNRNFMWSVKINKKKNWIGIGVCNKDVVVRNNLTFNLKGPAFENGCFIISTNKYSWNSNNPNQNNKIIEGFPDVNNGDEIIFKYSHKKEKLQITIHSFNYCLTNVSAPLGELLVPAVVFLNFSDDVTFNLVC
jgi:hypothetical protein